MLIRRFYKRPHEDQILVTFGAGIVIVEAVRGVFGGASMHLPTPAWGQGIARIGFLFYPLYRLELIGIVAALLGALYVVLYGTSIGLVVRAGIEDATTVGILGINVRRAFLLVFAIGVATAGVSGMLYAPIVSVQPDMGENFLVESFVVIVIGGLGSFPGRGAGRADRGRDHFPHQRLQLRLVGCDALCGDGVAAGAAAAGSVRARGAGLMASRLGGAGGTRGRAGGGAIRAAACRLHLRPAGAHS